MPSREEASSKDQARSPQTALTEGIRGFSQRVLRYFLAFLETDFKRQQAPRRRIQLKTDTNFRAGMPLRKYRTLFDAAWRVVQQTIKEGLVLRVRKGAHSAPISATLQNLIRQHVAELPAASFDRVRAQTLEYAKRNRSKSVDNPEKFVESVQVAFVEAVGTAVIQPVLALLEGPFREQAYSAVETVYEIETDLTDALAEAALAVLPDAVNSYVVRGETVSIEKVLAEFFSEKDTKERITWFFEDFATADAFQELRDVLNYARTGENLQFYVYLCDIRFGNAAFPLFYIPAATRFDDQKSEYVIELDPHLFVNKQAIDWILQEHRGQAGRAPISPVEDRIMYLTESDSFADKMSAVLRKLVPSFELTAEIDVRARNLQSASSPFLKLSNAVYFAVFDKGDEAVLNDYEALLTSLTEDQQGAGRLFENIIRGFLTNDPISVREKVDDRWDATPIPERLLAVSPIPINEEQTKILSALREPDCRYLAIQGPPGTGKSHTITAIAFDCILGGRNVLILSDKQEALDVVESKLSDALSAVRHGEDFPNPILRLGRTGGTYTRLISHSSQEKIRQQYRAHKSHAESLERDTAQTRERVRGTIEKTIHTYAGVKLSDIEQCQRLAHELDAVMAGYSRTLEAPLRADLLAALSEAMNVLAVAGCNATILAEMASRAAASKSGSLQSLLTASKICSVASIFAKDPRSSALRLFGALKPSDRERLVPFIAEYQSVRWPVFGYLFSGAKARAVTRKLVQTFPSCTHQLDLHTRLADLIGLVEILGRMSVEMHKVGLDDAKGEDVYLFVLRPESIPANVDRLRLFLDSFKAAYAQARQPMYGHDAIKDARAFVVFLHKAAQYACLFHRLRDAITSVPHLDYVGEKSKLEQMYTSKMTYEIDRRFIDFVDNKKATAKSLGGVIKAKQQFPQDQFDSFKQAFPCVIAGIREFAEYVPLKTEIFDVVVIDEASQVSVAQAFPALLRAQKVVVFGDHRQFSNVKSAQASNAVNESHLADIEAHFRQTVSTAADKIQRLKQFDVKKSVLEFFDLIASYSDMLRKHFRGYQELISFSSKTFYGGQLQAIKVRGKPIDDVIKFTIVEHDGRVEKLRNVNSLEGETIREELRNLVDDEAAITVGILTPFREQQQYLSRLLFNDSYAQRFENDLKLKVMTFDTCQGEERDLIIYSMVATLENDLLNYIFPVDLTSAVDRVEEGLKVQRLNVGFSRAKEAIWFVLSKPLDQFRGSIARVLNHYESLLNEKAIAEPGDTDPSSPMEAKVLDWIKKTPFFQKNEENLELIAQFPIGDYIRQLDPRYEHPAYRCDFLLRYQSAERAVNVVLEYDGFAEHFIERQRIHEGNYDRYYRPEDIERQMVIESYGYKFLRLNRFNLGIDPIGTLSERLSALTQVANDNSPGTVGQIRNDALALAEGDAKHCPKCDQIRPLSAFLDPALKEGIGRICTDCKKTAKPAKLSGAGRRFRRIRPLRWRRYE